MLGHDVKYSSKMDDAQLILTAKKEQRVLLTRDLELYQRATAKGISAFYLEGKTEAERLAQLAKRFNIKLDIDMTISRCTKCNTHVKPISKKKTEGIIEENTFSHYNDFWECTKCGQIYWQGAHWTKIKKTLEAAKENLRNSIESSKPA
jgi:uncharacterized protein with PIN domain